MSQRGRFLPPKYSPHISPDLHPALPPTRKDTDSGRKIRVRQLPSIITVEYLELYFESTKRFGHQLTVQDVDLDQEHGVAIVTFKTSSDAKVVLQKHRESPCTLNQQEIVVDEFKEDQADRSFVADEDGRSQYYTPHDNVPATVTYTRKKHGSSEESIGDESESKMVEEKQTNRSLSSASLSAPGYTRVTLEESNPHSTEYYKRLRDDSKLTEKKISSTSAYSDKRKLGRVGRDDSKLTEKKISSTSAYTDNPFNRERDSVDKSRDDSKLTEKKISSTSAYTDNPFNRELDRVGKAREGSKLTEKKISSISVYSDTAQNRKLGRVGYPRGSFKLFEKKISSSCVYSDTAYNRKLGRVGYPRDDFESTEKEILSTSAYSDNSLRLRFYREGKARDDSKLTEKKISSTSTYSDNPFDRELDRMGKDRNYSPGPESRILSKGELDSLCRVEGRKSPFLLKKCEKVCSYIKGISDVIVHVWPAYKTGIETEVVFIVFARRNLDLDNLEWTTELRIAGKYTETNNTLLFCKENQPLSTEIAREISSVIDLHSEDLMRKHKYLSAISASSAMFEANEIGEQIIVPKACIVLYVLVAEFMPLFEDKYPETLGKFPVDVREGEFRFCGASATEFQKTLCMGCKITSSANTNQFSTLGGFVEHPEYGLCGISCAHGFFNEQSKFNMLQKEVYNAYDENISVHQPSSEDKNRIGRLINIVFKKGNDQRAGVDLAMFTIAKRPPIAGTFPDNNTDTDKNKYESGKVWGKRGIPLNKQQVHKFGCVSGKTHGNIIWTNMAVKEIPFTGDIQGYPANYTLFKQYEIISEDKDKRFCELGDSGSLVFMEDEQHDDFRCIGMVVGFVDNSNTTAVTPITDILKELDINSLKSFQQKVNLDPINKRLEDIENRLHGMESLLRDIRDKIQ